MIVYRADWVLPVARPPIRNGCVGIESGRIVDVGSGGRDDGVHLGSVAIMPALVNAHTHLELSYLKGAVPPAERFIDWIRPLMAARRAHPDPADSMIVTTALAAISEARVSGTGLLGDVSNTLVTVPLLHQAGMPARVFYELLGFSVSDPEGLVRAARGRADEAAAGDGPVRVSLAAHAPYSVSPALFAAIRADLDAHRSDVSSVHLAEAAEEVEFLRTGKGRWRDLLRELDVWSDAWRPPAASPVGYLDDLGFLDSRVLAVHGVQCSGDDLARLRARGTTLVTCPRSNQHVGAGAPPIEAFYAMGATVALGTDSLASVGDLNLFAELREARRLAPRVVARDLLASATLHGARALGFDKDFGSIEPGKQASLIGVRLPDDVGDVEEYLVSGIEPSAIMWLDARV